jgi:branched-chain amino acid transport system substrate-binding protein
MGPTSTRSLLAPLGIALVFCVGCGGGAGSTELTSKGLPDEIVIGAAISKTGYLAPYDSNISAVEQLVDETNATGGIDGHKVRIVEADNHSETQQAAVAAQRVIEEGADVLLFSSEALIAAAAAPVAEENDELNFTMAASEPGFGPPATSRLSFSPNPSLLGEASARASFLYGMGLRSPFLFRDTSIIYGKIDCSAFQKAWEHLGGKIAGSADFKNSDESIASQISEFNSTPADSIMMCSYPPGGAAAIKQIRAADIDVPIAVSSTFDGRYWMEGIPGTDNIYATLNGSAYDPPNRATAKLYNRLEDAGVDTDVSSALLASYAAGQLILRAIEEAGTVDGSALADALEAKPHSTILGQITYTKDNHYPNGSVWPIYGFSGGKPKLITKVRPQFIPKYGG